MYLPMVNIGLKMVWKKPKHVAKKLMYCSCVKMDYAILLNLLYVLVKLIRIHFGRPSYFLSGCTSIHGTR